MSAPTNPQEHIFAPIAAAIATATDTGSGGVKSFFGAEHLAKHGDAPRYVWVPTTGTASYELAPINEEPDHADEQPEFLGNIDYTFEVYCHHGTHDQAWLLLQHLIRAAREILSDAQFRIGGIDASPSDISLRGWLLTVSLVVTIPIWSPENEWTAVEFTNAVLDDSQGNETDGVLTAPGK